MDRSTRLLLAACLLPSLLIWAVDGCCSPGTNGDPNTPSDLPRIDLGVVKLTTESTTTRGPAAGDNVLAFNVLGNSALAYYRLGDLTTKVVPEPTGRTHDADAFMFGGKKLVVRDRNSGALYVYDTESEPASPVVVQPTSINMGGSGGPNLWEVDGDLIATFNSVVTTTDGAGKRVKLVDITDPNAIVITPFAVNPTSSDAIDIDTAGGSIAVRDGDDMYIYDINDANATPTAWTRSALSGGFGAGTDISIDGNYVAFFDNDDNFTILDHTTGSIFIPARNPTRSERGLAFGSSRFAYVVTQTADDGGTVAVMNRVIAGLASDVTNLLDTAGAFVNGSDDTDGRVGFGLSTSCTPDGQYVFVAGESAVGVSDRERLYVSVNGGAYQIVEDAADALNALKAAAVDCSSNLVAFLIPAASGGSNVAVGYATLPP